VAFINLEKQLFENTTVMLKPRVTVISSSVGGGATGSAHIYPVRSSRVRQTYDPSFTAQLYNQGNQEAFIEAVANHLFIGFTNYGVTGVETIINLIDALEDNIPKNVIQNKTIPICRFDSPTFFNKEHTIINNIVKVLQPQYQHHYPDSGLHYGNYHTLNFFTGSEVPNDACLIYPNINGQYYPTNAFSLDFWINPRYDNQTAGAEYHAGTIFHMSSSIALSLVSGSQTDEFGKVSSFKLLLQLSQSADFNPRTVDLSNPNSGGYPRDLIFTSSQELNKNHWHHICVRWGGQNTNNYSGSIVIDDNSTNFYIPSSSIHTNGKSKFGIDGDTVVLGNFLDAPHVFGRDLFNSTVASNQGLYSRSGGTEPSSAEQVSALSNRLNAEIHDVKFFNKYLNNQELEYLRYNGISNQPILNENGENVSGETNLYDNLKFYVPVFFFPYYGKRREIPLIGLKAPGFFENGYGGPDNTILSRTFHPFNVDISNRQGMRDINLENFVLEFKRSNLGGGYGHPRLQSLSSSVMLTSEGNIGNFSPNTKHANYFRDQLKARNLSILPSDNGQFSPNYYPVDFNLDFLDQPLIDSAFNTARLTSLKARYLDESFDKISLDKILYKRRSLASNGSEFREDLSGLEYPDYIEELDIGEGFVGERLTQVSAGSDGDVFHQLVGTKPDSYLDLLSLVSGYELQTYFSIPSRLRTTYSNQMTVFDISNLYYGNTIAPGSFEIFDNSVTGSGGIVKIKLKDNEHGSLYRADCLTKQATWNNVGDIYYNEGLVLIKSPHMSFYCKDRTEISLTGEQNLHTLIMNIPVETGLVNSSSNATFKSMPPSENINDADKETVYITGVNIHDNNFNIIMKAQFAQPIIKADDDEFIIRLKQDF